MARSFRAAEQFVLTRAAAVIVPSAAMREAAVERGARAEDVFLIPPPLELAAPPPAAEDGRVRLLAPEAFLSGDALPAPAAALFELFAAVIAEVPHAGLVMVGTLESSAAAQFFSAARKMNLENRVIFLPAEEMPRAFTLADVVVAGLSDTRDSSAAETAMANGRAVLAADGPAHRELSSDGRGCLWFTAGDRNDLARRAVFLAQDASLRAALGRAGHQHLQETRTGRAVARAYDAAYRHAFARRRAAGPHVTFGGLQPLHA
jgi:Glycosyl transferases group 1